MNFKSGTADGGMVVNYDFTTYGIGSWKVVQLIKPNRTWSSPTLTQTWSFKNSATFLFDQQDPYYFPTNFGSRFAFGDGPGMLLPGWAIKAVASDTLKTYLMFLPPPPPNNDSKWVPVGAIDWGWSGTATKQSGKWSVTSKSKSGPTYSPASDHPVWSQNNASGTVS